MYCAPGNAGIAELAECVPIGENAISSELGQFALEQAIDLVVVGPEDSAVRRARRLFAGQWAFPAFGPRKKRRSSKAAKCSRSNLLNKYNIPTAAYESFTDYEAARDYLRKQPVPIVIKADGLAAGKGVTVAQTLEEAEQALRDIMVDKVFGDAGNASRH